MVNPIKFTPLQAPPIYDGAIDLRPYMLDLIQQNTGGLINDRAPHAPTVVLADVIEFVKLELLYYANKMAERAATLHLQTCGIQRRLGRKAQVTLTFTLSATLAQFVLSAGYMVSTNSGLEFFTDTDVTATNTFQFTVVATAKEVGTQYNVAAFQIINLSQTRAFLAGVTNTEPAQGGLDEETEDEAKARGYQVIRRKRGTLISVDDFEQYAQEVLGLGSVAKAIGLLTPDRSERKAGFVHVFALNPDGTVLNEAQRFNLQAELSRQFPIFLDDVEGQKVQTISSGVAVSSIDLYPLEPVVIATLIPGDNPDTRAAAIYNALLNYLRPGRLPLGQTIVLYSLISIVQNAGVKDVQSLTVNVATFDGDEISVETFYSNIQLPSVWTAAFCNGVSITLVNPSSNESFEYVYGDGGDLD